jgi:hypothetical protein
MSWRDKGSSSPAARESSIIGRHRDLENERAKCSVGMIHSIGPGSSQIDHTAPTISAVVFAVCDPQHRTTSDTDESRHASIGSRM